MAPRDPSVPSSEDRHELLPELLAETSDSCGCIIDGVTGEVGYVCILHGDHVWRDRNDVMWLGREKPRRVAASATIMLGGRSDVSAVPVFSPWSRRKSSDPRKHSKGW